MKRFLIFCFLLFSLPAFFCAQLSPLAGGGFLELNGYISSWTQDCSGGKCSLPRPSALNRPARLRLGLPESPGEAAATGASEKFLLESEGELTAEINFYAICPYVGKSEGPRPGAGSSPLREDKSPQSVPLGEDKSPQSVPLGEDKSPQSVPLGEDKCPGRYFQAQVSLSGAAEAFCSAALNVADFSPFPVLMCAGARKPGQRVGITLHRRSF